jgi:hypothetical protein
MLSKLAKHLWTTLIACSVMTAGPALRISVSFPMKSIMMATYMLSSIIPPAWRENVAHGFGVFEPPETSLCGMR